MARGRLTIFFGAAPGVGKTFAMLQQAGYERDVSGRSVLVGIVDTHGRFETNTLLAGFSRLPRKKTGQHEDLDLDAALECRPSLLLVDDLAHANAEGARHKSRYQDVQEVLESGIDVYATLNVQHIESLHDVVEQITGVSVQETVPDSLLDGADEIKLIDLPPDELLDRLRAGKVFIPARAETETAGFFRKGNLIALRELALRCTAERVDAEMLAYRKEHRIEKTWAASDRLLVCISPSPYSANLLRVGRRMAQSLRASWYAVNVETEASRRLPAEDRARITQNLRLAEQLGAEAVTLPGENAADEILRFARERNVTKIVAGKPRARSLRDRLRGSFVDELVRGSGDIDVYVTLGEEEAQVAAPVLRPREREHGLGGYLAAVAIVSASTVVARVLFGQRDLADVVMTYILGIVVLSTRFGFRASVVGAVLSVLCFDFFFIPPFLTFSVVDLRHVVTFAVMLLVAVVIAGLTQRVRDQVEVARRGERRTAALLAMSRELSRAQGLDAVVRAAAKHLEEFFESQVVVFASEAGGLRQTYRSSGLAADEAPSSAVRWVASHQREAGLSTETLPSEPALFVPLRASDPCGVLGLHPRDAVRFGDPEQRRLLDAFAAQMAMAMERSRLTEEMQQARLQIEAEQLRSTLLSSVSHDLRTPLAVITGAASALLDEEQLSAETRKDMAATIAEEAERLERLVRNLLDMTRIESGAVKVHKEWHAVEEVVGAALNRLEAKLEGRTVSAHIDEMLLAPFDAVLIEQVLVNLLENAAKYTPVGSAIEIGASRNDAELLLQVADRGPGIPEGERASVFEKFHRGSSQRTVAGFGLGLTICRAIVIAHDGRIWVEGREGGGAVFKIALPVAGTPPQNELADIPHAAGSQRGAA